MIGVIWSQSYNLAYSKVLPVTKTVIVVYTTNTDGKVNLLEISNASVCELNTINGYTMLEDLVSLTTTTIKCLEDQLQVHFLSNC